MVEYAVTTEKAAGGIEKENKLVFIVNSKATKKTLKEEVEKNYGKKVKKVNMMNTPQGRKKAIVFFVEKGAALDLASKLKVI